MAYKITISSEKLIDALEEALGNVYENIKEDDVVSDIQFHYGGDVEITIGEEE